MDLLSNGAKAMSNRSRDNLKIFINAIFMRNYSLADSIAKNRLGDINLYEVYEEAQRCSGKIDGVHINYPVSIALYELAHKGKWSADYLGELDYPTPASLFAQEVKPLTFDSIGNWLRAAEDYENHIAYFSPQTFDYLIVEQDPTYAEAIAVIGSMAQDNYCLERLVELVENRVSFLREFCDAEESHSMTRGRWLASYVRKLNVAGYLPVRKDWLDVLESV
jgi:hypothetical protein